MKKLKLLSLIILPLTISFFASCAGTSGKKREDVYLTINDADPIYFYEKEEVKEYPEKYITGDINFKADDSIKLFYKGKDVSRQSTIVAYNTNNLDAYYKIKNDAKAKVEFKATREDSFDVFVNGKSLPSLDGYYVKINDQKLALNATSDTLKEPFYMHEVRAKAELKKDDRVSFYKGDSKITRLLPSFPNDTLVGGAGGDYIVKMDFPIKDDVLNIGLEILEEGVRPIAVDTQYRPPEMYVEITYNDTLIGNYTMRTIDNKPEDHYYDYGVYNMSILKGYQLSFYFWSGLKKPEIEIKENNNLKKINDTTFEVLRDYTPTDDNTYAINIWCTGSSNFYVYCNG